MCILVDNLLSPEMVSYLNYQGQAGWIIPLNAIVNIFFINITQVKKKKKKTAGFLKHDFNSSCSNNYEYEMQ